jgi:trk system potassium uptake protein TrkH
MNGSRIDGPVRAGARWSARRLAIEARQRLEAAQLAGAGALATLGQFAVDMPGGYFGRSDHMTPVGYAFVALQLLLVALGVRTRLRHRRRAQRVASLLLSLNLGLFVAPLATDAVVAGGVVLWHAALLGHLLFPRRVSGPLRSPGAGELGSWLVRLGPALRHLLLVSLLASTAVVGYGIGDRVPAMIVCLLLGAAAVGLGVPFLRLLWGAGARWRLLPMALLLLAAVATAGRPAVALTFLALLQGLLLLQLLLALPTLRELLDLFFSRPPLLIAGTFLLLIASGTLLLSFPAASADGTPIDPVDALFTATSASCVTGLIVLDTPVDFSFFGQLVILALLQVGGLNIMVLSTFAALILGRSPSLRQERALGEVLDLQPERSAFPLIRFIVVATLATEGVGAGCLAVAYHRLGEALPQALWKGTFHAVSAFCNAGFALHSDSLVGFRENPLVLGTVAALITAGGLGFAVLAAGWQKLHSARRSPLATQVQLVLVTSATLVVAGTAWYAAAEWHRSLAGLGTFDKLTNALFQSVTLRTAGFNSVDFAPLQPSTILLMLAFMFIGASPGSTGGGIKTTTAAVLLSAIPALARGRRRVVLFGRALPLETVYRAAAIAVISATLVFLATGLLLATQPLAFDRALFEVVSAVATVGLSLGATAEVDTLGKIVLIVAMFLGRIGPLTLAFLLGRQGQNRLRYPEARVMVG